MKPRRGFALLASVWLMVVIAAVSLNVALLARSRRLATANALEGVRTRAAALAGLEHARGRLTRALVAARNDALADPWRALAASASATLGPARYAVRVRDDAAALDVNLASDEMLARLLVACGAEARTARHAAERIADWRDPDQHRRADGAEREDYLAAGARALPADADVRAVDELDDVLDLPAAPWRCAREHLVVDGAGVVNPNTAPVEVLQALPGLGENAAAAVIAARAEGVRFRDFRELAAVLPPHLRGALDREAVRLQRLLTYETSAVRVVSEASMADSPSHAVAESLMRRTGATVFVEWSVVR
jgi:general secretion pathway protein K